MSCKAPNSDSSNNDIITDFIINLKRCADRTSIFQNTKQFIFQETHETAQIQDISSLNIYYFPDGT